MQIKFVNRYSPTERIYRLFRIMWVRGTVGDGRGYSAKLTFAITPDLFRFRFLGADLYLVFLFVRIHYERSYGGTHA